MGEVAEALPVLRRAAAEAAEAEGLAIAAAATHPFALPEAQPIVKEERYVTFVGYGGISVAPPGRAGTARSRRHAERRRVLALPRGDHAVAAGRARALGELALVRRHADGHGVEPRAACSPSCRAAGGPPAFSSYGEWEAWVERLVRLGVAEDYTRIWWDVRPHPKLGTLEVRIADQPTDVALSSSFAALLQAMCATALDGGLPGGETLGDRGRADYAAEPLGAARFGPAVSCCIRTVTGSCPRRSSGQSCSSSLTPAARSLGGADALARIDPAACEADLQLQSNSAVDAAAGLVARTLG